MKSPRLLLLLPLMAALASCGGKGSSAPAPGNLQIAAQDTQLHLTWDALSGVEYWVFCAPNASAIDSHSSPSAHSGWLYHTQIFSGSHYVTGLNNGTPYACVVNGRYDQGPGGPDAVPSPRTSTPAYAGASWQAGTTSSLSGMTVRSVAYGLPTGLGLTAEKFVAVGDGGKVVSSSALDSNAVLGWGSPAQISGVTANFKAVSFYAAGNRFVAVGDSGQSAYSSDGSSWTAVSLPSSSASMNALTSSGAPLIAVGNDGSQGLIYTSADSGSTWSAVSGVNTSTLRSVVYVPASTPYWIAVGDGGVVLKSLNGSSWTASTPAGNTVNFQAVAMLPVMDGSAVVSYRVVAAGNNGSVIASTDGDNWTATSVSSSPWVALHASKGQFMAVDATGQTFTSNLGSSTPWVWNTGVASGLSSVVSVLRYTPASKGVSNGWMVFDSNGLQQIAR